jgi:hypothetical protein
MKSINHQPSTNTMKTILALAAVMLAAAVSAQAEWVNGHFRSNGTYVNSYYRTPANGIPYDNLSYRGYPSQQPGYVSPRSYGLDSSWSLPTPLPSYRSYAPRTLPYTGGCTPTPLIRRSTSLGF